MRSKNTDKKKYYGKERIATLIYYRRNYSIKIWGFFFFYLSFRSPSNLGIGDSTRSPVRRNQWWCHRSTMDQGRRFTEAAPWTVRIDGLQWKRSITGALTVRTTAGQNQKFIRLGPRHDFEAHLEEHVRFIIHR